jgi:hypothetical protein
MVRWSWNLIAPVAIPLMMIIFVTDATDSVIVAKLSVTMKPPWAWLKDTSGNRPSFQHSKSNLSVKADNFLSHRHSQGDSKITFYSFIRLTSTLSFYTKS